MISVENNSKIVFKNNKALAHPAIYFTNIALKGNSAVTIVGNVASTYHGGISLHESSSISFQDSSIVEFIDNSVLGGIFCNYSNVTFGGNSIARLTGHSWCSYRFICRIAPSISR